jgi:hypothetical protein
LRGKAAVQVDALALRLRARSNLEACDLGVRLCQRAALSVFPCYLAVLLPVLALSLASRPIASWAPWIALWWAKPWLDRTVLFTLSRAAFGQRTRLSDLWRAQRKVLWSQLLITLLAQRLSPWRSFTQPVYQLEGVAGAERRKRVQQIRARRMGIASGVTFLFFVAEQIIFAALVSLVFWLAPMGYTPSIEYLFSPESPAWIGLVLAAVYAAVIALLEPFYVAAGFAMYLNRRAELEAWDIEQELRRAFTH